MWIKVDHSMPDKPEVVAIAEALGMEHEAVIGRLIRLWIWADQQVGECNALSVTKTFLDRYTFAPGFTDALLKVGWLKGKDGAYFIPNFDRHNGNSAKQRALAFDRVKRKRNAASVTKALPDKIREDIKNPYSPFSRDGKRTPPNPNTNPDPKCGYCGAQQSQMAQAHETDHFIPVAAGGTDDPENLILACHRCNQAKSGRVFKTVEECREWLHRAYWTSKRKRWIEHQRIAFGGKPPKDLPGRSDLERFSCPSCSASLTRKSMRWDDADDGSRVWHCPMAGCGAEVAREKKDGGSGHANQA